MPDPSTLRRGSGQALRPGSGQAGLRTGLDHKLAALTDLSSEELKEAWRRWTLTPVPLISPSLLRLALAWEYQAHALGGLSRAAQQQLDQIGRAKTCTTRAPPGTRLVRSWRGKAHVVIIGEDRVIRWDDRDWNSLSEVARAITGTRWSGPAFFGLKTSHDRHAPVGSRNKGRAA